MAHLIVLTTSGSIDYLKGAIQSLNREKNDILIIDDGSKQTYTEFDDKYKIIKKEIGRGLTHSWNLAYQYFKNNNYDMCCFSNDDVIFPSRVPEDMWNGLSKYKLIGPLSDPIGSGRFWGEFQNIDTYLRGNKDYKNAIYMQEKIQHIHPNRKYLELYNDIKGVDLFINGFCFSFDRKIIDYEYSKDILFNPAKINTGNEKELQMYRLLDGKAISIKSYVFHYKGASIPTVNDRQIIINK